MSTEEVTIESQQLKVILSKVGAGVIACFARKKQAGPSDATPGWLPLFPDARTTDLGQSWFLPVSQSSFIMVPYSNRIAHGTFKYNGTEYRLTNPASHSIHGFGCRTSWDIKEKSATHVVFQMKHPKPAPNSENVDWPFSFESEVTYSIKDGTTFSSEIVIRNTDSVSWPVGGGFHPYFSRFLEAPNEPPARLHVNYTGIYPTEHIPCIPSGPPRPPEATLNFSKEQDIPPSHFYDFCASGYDGGGTLRWPAHDIGVRFRCSSNLRYLVMYNPIEKPYFCVEPVMNATNAINMADSGDGIPHGGLTVLSPNESVAMRFDMVVE